MYSVFFFFVCFFVFFQAEDGIRDLVRSRGLGDVYKRQLRDRRAAGDPRASDGLERRRERGAPPFEHALGRPRGLSLIHI